MALSLKGNEVRGQGNLLTKFTCPITLKGIENNEKDRVCLDNHGEKIQNILDGHVICSF